MKLRFPPRIEVEISSRNFWVKVVEFLQQNWALIVHHDATGVTVHFVDDVSGVFDRLSFPTLKTAEAALRRNVMTATLRTRNYSPFCARHPRRSMRRNTRADRFTPQGDSGDEGDINAFLEGNSCPQVPQPPQSQPTALKEKWASITAIPRASG